MKYLLLAGLYIPLAMHGASTTGETKRSAEAKTVVTYDQKATELMFKYAGNPTNLEALLETGKADITAENEEGFSLLSAQIELAKTKPFPSMRNSIIIAMKYGANPAAPAPRAQQPNPTFDPAYTLLHLAAATHYNHPRQAKNVIDSLLSKDSYDLVTLQDSQGRTSLMVAIEAMNAQTGHNPTGIFSYTAIIRALLNHGASILMVDNAGHDSLYYARNNPEILKILQDELAHREAQEKAHKEAIYESPDMVRTGMPRSVTDIISSYESSPK